MTETTPRQLLYALVAGGFLGLVLALVIGSAAAGLVPPWWTAAMSVLLVAGSAWTALRWKSTAMVLLVSIGLLVLWTVGTLLVT